MESYEGTNDEAGTPIIWYLVKPQGKDEEENIESFVKKMNRIDPNKGIFGVLHAAKS